MGKGENVLPLHHASVNRRKGLKRTSPMCDHQPLRLLSAAQHLLNRKTIAAERLYLAGVGVPGEVL